MFDPKRFSLLRSETGSRTGGWSWRGRCRTPSPTPATPTPPPASCTTPSCRPTGRPPTDGTPRRRRTPPPAPPPTSIRTACSTAPLRPPSPRSTWTRSAGTPRPTPRTRSTTEVTLWGSVMVVVVVVVQVTDWTVTIYLNVKAFVSLSLKKIKSLFRLYGSSDAFSPSESMCEVECHWMQVLYFILLYNSKCCTTFTYLSFTPLLLYIIYHSINNQTIKYISIYTGYILYTYVRF